MKEVEAHKGQIAIFLDTSRSFSEAELAILYQKTIQIIPFDPANSNRCNQVQTAGLNIVHPFLSLSEDK